MELGTISLRRTFSHAISYYLLYCIAFLVVLALCGVAIYSGHSLRVLELRDYSTRHCSFVPASDRPVLRILDAVYLEGIGTVNVWCQSPELSEYYGAVELHSVHRDHLDIRELYESHYALILAKPEMIGSPAGIPKEGIGYELIAQYPDYGSQLVSLQGTPELSEKWMKGKVLGLLDDPNSVSAYQIPRATLKKAGLSNEPAIVYFRTYRELYRALFDGRVDVVASILSNEGPDSALQLPPGLVLEQELPGAGWYIDSSLITSDQYCNLVAGLEELARNSRVDYFRKLRVVMPCRYEN